MNRLQIYFLLFSISIGYCQSGGYTYFESGTLEDWANSDSSLTNLVIEQPGSDDSYYFKKTCDGSNTINGEMAIRNLLWFQDNYMNGGAGIIYLKIRNENTFDLHLRLGFTDYDGSKIIMTNPIIVSPSIGVWQEINIDNIHPQAFTLIEGPNSIEDILFGTFEMRLIHNESISFNGAYENGIFEVDNIGTVYLAGVDEFNNDSVIIYPIPTKDVIYIKTNSSFIGSVEVLDLLGRKKDVKYNNHNEVDLSNLKNGIYFLRLSNKSGTITKKIIKT